MVVVSSPVVVSSAVGGVVHSSVGVVPATVIAVVSIIASGRARTTIALAATTTSVGTRNFDAHGAALELLAVGDADGLGGVAGGLVGHEGEAGGIAGNPDSRNLTEPAEVGLEVLLGAGVRESADVDLLALRRHGEARD